jgi:hypothetical protein
MSSNVTVTIHIVLSARKLKCTSLVLVVLARLLFLTAVVLIRS